jgi:hypothetical protein
MPSSIPQDASLVFRPTINHLQHKHKPAKNRYTHHVQPESRTPSQEYPQVYYTLGRMGGDCVGLGLGGRNADTTPIGGFGHRIIHVAQNKLPFPRAAQPSCVTTRYFWRTHIAAGTSHPSIYKMVDVKSLVLNTHLEHAICRESGFSAAHPLFP